MIDVTCFNWVKMIQKSKLGPYEKYVAHYLSTYMNLNNEVAWPSQSRMREEMSIAKSTVIKALNKLESEGWLIRDRGNPTTNTRYHIDVPKEAIKNIALGGSPLDGLGSTPDGLRSTCDGLGVVRETDTNNNSNNKRITNRFKPPTPEEVGEYATGRGYLIDAERFVDFYSSKGWMVGKSPMKDWQAAVRNWAKNNKQPETKAGFIGI